MSVVLRATVAYICKEEGVLMQMIAVTLVLVPSVVPMAFLISVVIRLGLNCAQMNLTAALHLAQMALAALIYRTNVHHLMTAVGMQAVVVWKSLMDAVLRLV